MCAKKYSPEPEIPSFLAFEGFEILDPKDAQPGKRMQASHGLLYAKTDKIIWGRLLKPACFWICKCMRKYRSRLQLSAESDISSMRP